MGQGVEAIRTRERAAGIATALSSRTHKKVSCATSSQSRALNAPKGGQQLRDSDISVTIDIDNIIQPTKAFAHSSLILWTLEPLGGNGFFDGGACWSGFKSRLA